MTLCVQFERDLHRLRFEEFPTAPVAYCEEAPQNDPSFIHLKVADAKTKQIQSVFFKAIDLQGIGISITTWKAVSPHLERLSTLLRRASVIERLLQKALPVVSEHLTPEYLAFFKNTSYANRVISNAIHSRVKRFCGVEGVPGMYFSFTGHGSSVFINLKKTRPLGEGAFGKVRKVLWLDPPDGNPQIIAKKVLQKGRSKYASNFYLEIILLSKLSGKRGIISTISTGIFEDKPAMFLPAYECNLLEYMNELPFPLSLDEKLSLVSQWLEGLATISDTGIHGDLKPENLLLRRGKEGIEGVISDFGSYRLHGHAEAGFTTIAVAPPEYYAAEVMTLKHDVWGMGISLHEMFSERSLSCWQVRSVEDAKVWTSRLTPGWILRLPAPPDVPRFVLKLISQMLDPRFDRRPSPKDALNRFLAGRAAFIDSSKKAGCEGALPQNVPTDEASRSQTS